MTNRKAGIIHSFSKIVNMSRAGFRIDFSFSLSWQLWILIREGCHNINSWKMQLRPAFVGALFLGLMSCVLTLSMSQILGVESSGHVSVHVEVTINSSRSEVLSSEHLYCTASILIEEDKRMTSGSSELVGAKMKECPLCNFIKILCSQ